MNKVLLIGRVGKDPEVKKINASTVCTLSLATSEKFKDKEGKNQENTEWHNVVFWGRPAEVIGQYVTKGAMLAIEGKNKTRTYDDKQGVKHYVTEVLATSFEFIGGTKKEEHHTGGSDFRSQQQPAFVAEDFSNQQPGDDLPF